MEKSKWHIIIYLFSLLSFGNCENKEMAISNQELPKCADLSEDLIEFQKVENQESLIEILLPQHKGERDTIYLIDYPQVPSGKLYGCNLPIEFKQSGIPIIFSGTVYIPKGHELMNLGYIPIELTNIQKDTSK